MIMDNRLLRLFYLASLVVLTCSAEYELKNAEKNERRAYDLDGLIERTSQNLRNSLKAEQFSELHNLKLSGFDEFFPFQPIGNLLQNSSKCLGDILYILENIRSQWALKMIDSFGKPESGVFSGNLHWIGDYDECVGIRSSNPNSTTVGNFRGKYCTLTLTANFGNLSVPMPITSSICIPDSCSADILKDDVTQLLHIAGVVPVLNGSMADLSSNSLTCKATERHLNAPAKAVIALLSIFCALVVVGSSVTAVQYFSKILKESEKKSFIVQVAEGGIGAGGRKKAEADSDEKALLPDDERQAGGTSGTLRKIDTVLKCFCIFTNGKKILNTDSSEGELLCIHGIRFLSMSWVIQGHAYMTGLLDMKNTLVLPDMMRKFAFQIVLQGFYSVDSFFVLSGFLLAYLSMKEFDRTRGSIAWPYFYIHRYIRLTPTYMLVLAFYTTVFLYLGSGPFWPDNDIDPICRDNWWRNLIYINNFTDQAQQCMAWAWYLANDMQFFVISPLFLITLWRWPKVGYSLIAVFLVACWTANFYITYHFDLPGGYSGIMSDLSLTDLFPLLKIQDYMNKIYIKPYTRIAPYLAGILTGYLLYVNKTIRNRKHSLVFLSVGWLVASAITLTCFFGLYHRHPDTVGNSFYNAFNRTGWALGLCWVIYVCLMEQGGFVNSILSFKGFVPLSRLTYAAYLIHPMVLGAYFQSLKSTMELSNLNIVMLYLGFMVVTYGLSLPVALTLESPIVSLEKLLRKSYTKEQKPETVN